MIYSILGIIMWGLIVLYVISIRPGSKLLKKEIGLQTDTAVKKRLPGTIVSCIVCLFTVLICILPMSLSPVWNGEKPQHRNQYEVMARSLAEGHIYLDYDDIDPRLEEMENPYSPAARIEADVNYHSDHAYYKGKYYMYFGVVPAVVVFLPYYLITGRDLTTYHGTQLFAALAIVGIFLLFHALARRFFPKLPRVILLSLCVALSWIPVYYSTDYSALYSTAIVSGVCFEVWSLYLFITAVYLTAKEKATRRVVLAVLGGLCGALAFGCRPTAAFGNLVLIPMLVKYIKDETSGENKTKTGTLLGRIALVLTPYVIIGVILMLYNYARFENPFEFGQAYQLTSFDQTKFGSLANFSPVETFNGLILNYIGFTPITGHFPYVYFNSVFVNFPILAFSFAAFNRRIRNSLKASGFLGLVIAIPVTVLIINFLQVQWGPGMANAERYRTDFYFLLAILAFLVIGHWYNSSAEEDRSRFSFITGLFCLEAVFMCMLLLMAPDDGNFTAVYPEMLEKLKHFVMIF
ncbi:MAG: hypothetical protein ILP13_09390 [Lachnospiraceae bacterium]|nr:hypothetical protein [Lachnospiraceae bacterium]